MNWTLFRANLRTNWILLLFIILIVMMYGSISVSMFDPESAEIINSMLELMPEGIIKAMGFDDLGTDLTQYVSSYLYGFIMIIFPLIYIIITTNNIMARHIDRGSMAYLLTTPNSRVRIASTQAFYLVKGIALICMFNTLLIIFLSMSMFPGMLDVERFLLLNLSTFLVLTLLGGIAFLSACSFSESRWSLAVGAGIPILFFVVDMLSAISEEVGWLQYATVFTLMDPSRVLEGGLFVLISCIATGVVSVLLYATGVVVFNRRSLAL